jgi:hypothetical protein
VPCPTTAFCTRPASPAPSCMKQGGKGLCQESAQLQAQPHKMFFKYVFLRTIIKSGWKTVRICVRFKWRKSLFLRTHISFNKSHRFLNEGLLYKDSNNANSPLN